MIPCDALGSTVTFSKTVGEYDVYAFAGVSGDFSPNHVNEQYMKESPYGQRIAHGALLVAYISTASVLMINKLGIDAVTYGYDRVRFPRAVLFGDTITVTYEIAEVEEDGRRANGRVTVINQSGEVVAAATHILYCFETKESSDGNT